MKHTHTHPNWKNLSEAEKANVRSANWANVRKKERIKELKKWVKSRPNGEAIVELELAYLEGRKERGSAEDDFANNILAIVKQYNRDKPIENFWS